MSIPAVPRLLIDTNVLLDLVLGREPWANDAARVLDACVRGRAEGLVAAHAITTVHYLCARHVGHTAARRAIHDLLDILTVVPTDASVLRTAIDLDIADFEDAVHAAAAQAYRATAIVTRNARDFRGSPIPVLAPAAALAVLQVAREGKGRRPRA